MQLIFLPKARFRVDEILHDRRDSFFDRLSLEDVVDGLVVLG